MGYLNTSLCGAYKVTHSFLFRLIGILRDFGSLTSYFDFSGSFRSSLFSQIQNPFILLKDLDQFIIPIHTNKRSKETENHCDDKVIPCECIDTNGSTNEASNHCQNNGDDQTDDIGRNLVIGDLLDNLSHHIGDECNQEETDHKKGYNSGNIINDDFPP